MINDDLLLRTNKMIDIIKYIIYTIIIGCYLSEYYDLNYKVISYNTVKEKIIQNDQLFNEIIINEETYSAYLKINGSDNVFYKTFFSNHEKFDQTIENLVGENYKNIKITYKVSKSVYVVIFNIVATILIAYYLLSIIQNMFFGKKKVSADSGQNEDDDYLSMLTGVKTQYFDIVKTSNIKYSDVIGLGSVKKDLNEFVKHLQFSKTYDEHGCELTKGLLFVGPPGVGKTYIAKAFAAESGATFLSTSGSNFNEIYVGTGSRRIRQLFKYARKHTPCVIFIDEIDAFGTRNNKYSSDSNNTVNALLTEMDGMMTTNGVIVIAATNNEELLDSALKRSGRFDKTITFDHPTLEERVELFTTYLRKIKLDDSFDLNDDIMTISKRTAKLTGADIKNICNQGILNHMKQYNIVKNDISCEKVLVKNTLSTGCTMQNLSDALDDICIGNKKDNKIMSNKEREQVAYHEAGHTLISCLMEGGSVPLKVTIIPRGHSLGFTQPYNNDNSLIYKNELLAMIFTTLGGRAAEEIQFEMVTSGASDDFKKVVKLVERYVLDYGFDGKLRVCDRDIQSDDYKSKMNERVEILLNTYYKFTCDVLRDNKIVLDDLARELMNKEVLHNNEIVEIIKNIKGELYSVKYKNN